MRTVHFNHDWYNNLVTQSNEKQLIIAAIGKLASLHQYGSCLEIGMGTGKQFSDRLAGQFNHYTIIEKEARDLPEHSKVRFIQADWEQVNILEQFDVIIASHVWYYFSDKKTAVQKMLDTLSENGILILVLNGPGADYGKIKRYFGSLVGHPYRFAYEEFLEISKQGSPMLEFTIPSTIRFREYEDLYAALQLGFDQYPEEYVALKPRVLTYMQENFLHHQFIIDQKLIILQQHPNGWEYLLNHPDYKVDMGELSIFVRDGVFTPDPQITFSTSWLLKHLPPMEGKEVLDIGCGSGIISIRCALQGAGKVLAADVDKRAIDNTIQNVTEYGLSDKVTVIQSNLFDRVHGRYDHIFGNLPILEEIWGQSISPIALFRQFLSSCELYIKPGGTVYFTWASFAPLKPLMDVLDMLKLNYKITSITEKGIDWHLFCVWFS